MRSNAFGTTTGQSRTPGDSHIPALRVHVPLPNDHPDTNYPDTNYPDTNYPDTNQPDTHPSDLDECEALAALFLGDHPATAPSPALSPAPSPALSPAPSPAPSLATSPASSPTRPPAASPARPPTVEILILGHLPGMGGTWAQQLARLRANTLLAPVALLRVIHSPAAPSHASLELVWPDGPVGRAAQDRWDHQQDSHQPDAAQPVTRDALAALNAVAAHTAHLVVRTDDTTETLAHCAALIPGADATLVTACDDPALVAAYRTLKSWHDHPPHQSTRQARRLPALVLVERDASRAADAQQRLLRAATSFLAASPPKIERLATLSPVRSTLVYSGQWPTHASADDLDAAHHSAPNSAPKSAHHAATLAAMLEAFAEPPAHTTPHTTSHTASTARVHVAAPAAPAPEIVLPRATDPAAHEAPAPLRIPALPPLSQPAPRTAGQAPSPRAAHTNSAPAPAADSHAAPDMLDVLARSLGVHLAGFDGITCPTTPRCALATDPDGALHILAWAQDAADVAPACVDLLATASWCADHALLLARAGLARSADAAHAAAMHLLTPVPKAARRVQDTRIAVHAVVAITAGTRTMMGAVRLG